MSQRAVQLSETRVAFLESGVQILSNPNKRLGNLTAVSTAELTKRTTGAFYNIWKDHEDFRRDLVAHILAPDFDIDLGPITVASRQFAESRVNASRAWASLLLGAIVASRTFRPRISVSFELETLEGTKELLEGYYTRNATNVAGSLAEGLQAHVDEPTSKEIVYLGDDLALRTVRGQMRHSESTIALSKHIPLLT